MRRTGTHWLMRRAAVYVSYGVESTKMPRFSASSMTSAETRPSPVTMRTEMPCLTQSMIVSSWRSPMRTMSCSLICDWIILIEPAAMRTSPWMKSLSTPPTRIFASMAAMMSR